MDQSFRLGVAGLGEELRNVVDGWHKAMALACYRAKDGLYVVYRRQDHPAGLVSASLDQPGYFEVHVGIPPLFAADESPRSAHQYDSGILLIARG